MPVRSIARTLLRLQYSVVRSPMTAFDARVLTRLPDSSRIKITLTRGLASLDAAAGRAKRDRQIEERGDVVAEGLDRTEQMSRSGTRADALQANAARAEQDAATQAGSRRSEAARLERERIAAALREEYQVQQHIGELADADAAEQKRQADLRAKHQQNEQDEQRRAKERRIAADRARNAAPATAQSDAAATTKTAVRARRTEADTPDRLVQTENEARSTTPPS